MQVRVRDAKAGRTPLHTPSDLKPNAVRDLSGALNVLLADMFAIAERVRKIGGTTLHSIGHVGRLQRVADNDSDFVTPMDMLAELRDDNKQLVAKPARNAWPLRGAQRCCHRKPVGNPDR
jgi:starvation-inducible DNA-binding protein